MDADRRPDSGDGLRAQWEKNWAQHSEGEMPFHVPDVPPKLRSLLEDGGAELPDGPGLDLGCGAGVVTAYMAGFFRPAIGIEIAHAALVRARRFAAERGAQPGFLVADARNLPIPPASVAFVFDRGCMQQLPRREWPQYVAQVAQSLKPGGLFQLFCCNRPGLIRSHPPVWTASGLRARVRRILPSARKRRAGLQELTPAFLPRLLPPSLQVVEMDEVPFEGGSDPRMRFVYGLFRRT